MKVVCKLEFDAKSRRRGAPLEFDAISQKRRKTQTQKKIKNYTMSMGVHRKENVIL